EFTRGRFGAQRREAVDSENEVDDPNAGAQDDPTPADRAGRGSPVSPLAHAVCGSPSRSSTPRSHPPALRCRSLQRSSIQSFRRSEYGARVMNIDPYKYKQVNGSRRHRRTMSAPGRRTEINPHRKTQNL